jgi:hypothetical protein
MAHIVVSEPHNTSQRQEQQNGYLGKGRKSRPVFHTRIIAYVERELAAVLSRIVLTLQSSPTIVGKSAVELVFVGWDVAL